ncbi:unnamed protein product [Somion occarium]|uniref:Uncharacterized protein n=1 Tax=Somion occarium TaxID=3059160 RepID=A0ABP1D3Q9_9APHY
MEILLECMDQHFPGLKTADSRTFLVSQGYLGIQTNHGQVAARTDLSVGSMTEESRSELAQVNLKMLGAKPCSWDSRNKLFLEAVVDNTWW